MNDRERRLLGDYVDERKRSHEWYEKRPYQSRGTGQT
jgi:hypothetical protein